MWHIAQAPTHTNPQSNSPPQNANANMHASANAIANLRASEGQRDGGGYYNDQANNCTVGTDILVHTGPCTAEEMRRQVDQQANERSFMARIAQAEADVRAQVPDRPLTQDQFDALLSAAFNSGPVGVRPVTARANANDDSGVVRELRSRVHIQHRDAQGHRVGPPVLSHGLVNRREREAQPFLTPQPQHRP